MAENYPTAKISNGIIKLKVYIPNIKTGFYRGPRFDWSGLIGIINYNGNKFYGKWWQEKRNPYANDQVMGPAGEFGMGFLGVPAPLGYKTAKPGETFLKIGVGELKKVNNSNYNFGCNYEIIKPIPWIIKKGNNWISFTQQVKNFKGYGYKYTHEISLVKGKPEFIDKYIFANIGEKEINQTYYCHNFTMINQTPVGPDYELIFPFKPKLINPPSDPSKGLVVKQNQLILKNTNGFWGIIGGFDTNKIKDDGVIVINKKTGTGIKIIGTHPIVSIHVWGTSKVICPELTINIKLLPGKKIEWEWVYRLINKRNIAGK